MDIFGNLKQDIISFLILLMGLLQTIRRIMVNLDKTKTIAILGDIDSGKTNLAFYFMNDYKGTRQRILYGYPKEVEGYKSLCCWTDLLKVKDSIIFIDEIQRYIKAYETQANHKLMEFISLLSHKNNTLIFTTQLTQFITKGVEGFIDCWAIKRICLDSLKNGSKPKRVIKRLDIPRKNNWVLDLEPNEYFEYCERNEIGENGIKQFPFQDVGKDWK